MDNLVREANERLQSIIDDLLTIKEEYERKINANAKEIDSQLALVKKYKNDFYTSKETVEKMNEDIEGFERDYESLVNRFKDDELASILVNVNKEISAKIEERKRKIIRDKKAMNSLVTKAEIVKDKLVKLTAEKNALEVCYAKICDAYQYYEARLTQIIDYSNDNKDNLCSYFDDEKIIDNVIKNTEAKFVQAEEEVDNKEVEEDVIENPVENVEEIKVLDTEEISDEPIEETEIEEQPLEEEVQEEKPLELDEEEVEFDEEDLIPEENVTNVIDLNYLNEQSMAAENEDDEIETSNEDEIIDEEPAVEPFEPDQLEALEKEEARAEETEEAAEIDPATFEEVEEKDINEVVEDNTDYADIVISDDLEDDDTIYENE